MATPREKLASSLEALHALQSRGVIAVRSSDLNRSHRERLLKAGFLQEVMKGWYIPSRQDEERGESTAWYASFWDFAAAYLTTRFKEQWSLSPEQSLFIHTGNRAVPPQLLVRSPRAQNNVTTLAHGTSLLEIRAPPPSKGQAQTVDGLRLFLTAGRARSFRARPLLAKLYGRSDCACNGSRCVRRARRLAVWWAERRCRSISGCLPQCRSRKDCRSNRTNNAFRGL